MQDALDAFYRYSVNPAANIVNINTLSTALCYGINHGVSSDWTDAFIEYGHRKDSPFTDERNAFLFGLACTTDSRWVQIYLGAVLDGTIPARDHTQALLYLVQNNVGLAAVWSYFSNSWQQVPSSIGKFTVLRSIASTFHEPEDLAAFEELVRLHPPADETQNQLFIQIRLLIQQNIDWFLNNYDDLSDWLAGQVTPPPTSEKAAANKFVMPISPYELLFPSAIDIDE